MKCPRCRQRPASPIAFVGVHLGPVWKDRTFACRHCGARLRPAGLARYGFGIVGLAVGLVAAGLVVPWLALFGTIRILAFLAIALPVAWAVDYQVVRAELAPGEDASVLPESSVVHARDE
jgi:hypothetical protein